MSELLERIRVGTLAPGERMPSERALALHFGVSRTTVRDALKTLVGLGVVRAERSSGIYVEGPTGALLGDQLVSVLSPADVRHLFEIRKAFEPTVSAWAALRATKQEADHLQMLVEKVVPKGADTPDDWPMDLDLAALMDREFHGALVRCAKNPIAVRLMENLLELLKKSRSTSLRIPGRALTSAKDHWRVAHAIVLRDPDAAREAMIVHLAGVEDAILQHLR